MTTRTYPNVFWIGLNLLCIFFLFGIAWTLIKVVDNALNDVEATSNLNIFLTIIFLIGFIIVGIATLLLVSQRFSYVIFSNSGLKIIKPFRLFNKLYSWNDLKGFSTSKIYFNAKETLLLSNSLVIYMQDNSTHEIIKIYNFKFSIVEETLKANNIVCLGQEPSMFYFRKYKFKNKP